MPLLMTERAITDRVADETNAGFLREDALLAVVVLTDEDDCSRTDDPITIEVPDPFSMPIAAADECDPTSPMIEPLSRFMNALDTVKGDRGRWAMAVIAGPGPGTCTSSFGDAIEAGRLKQFLMDAGDNTVFSSICDGDLTGGLMSALQTFDAACQSFPPLISATDGRGSFVCSYLAPRRLARVIFGGHGREHEPGGPAPLSDAQADVGGARAPPCGDRVMVALSGGKDSYTLLRSAVARARAGAVPRSS